MKRLFGLFLLVLCLSSNSQEVEAGVAGLSYQVYAAGGATPSYTQDANGNITNRTLLSTGTVSTVNYNWGGGYILNSNRAEGAIVRFYGYVNIPTAGTYYFGGNADDGIRIKVGGTQVVNGWNESGGDFRQSAALTMSAGVVPIELMYYENGGGALVTLYWYNDASGWQIIPVTSLATTSDYFVPPPAPTPTYSSGITVLQQSRKTANQTAYPNGHAAVVEITGDDNVVNIQQIGGSGHFVDVSVTGSVNNVEILQTSTGTNRHYMEAGVIGSNNNLILKQEGTSKTQFTTVEGNYNTVSTHQKGDGNHYLDLKVTGNSHTAGVVQDGAGSHKATVELSGTQPWNFQLNQTGTTNKTYSLPHNMSDGTTTSGACYTVGGCNLTINQQ